MMKVLLLVRWVVGLLFIFSGLVKANDPLGLSYKMQEFFEAWDWMTLYDYTLLFAIGMNVFEIVAGFALLLGVHMRILSWVLLALISFFTFLTGYASLATNTDGSMKFRSCGCFGDCIPLDPTQSFLKDLILLGFILLLILRQKQIKPVFQSSKLNLNLIVLSLLFGTASQWYTLRYLPVVDCLPYKKGNNLLELRKLPAGAIPDSFDIRFIYTKGGVEKEFKVSGLPDSTWTYKDRKQVLVRKGKNNEPLIKDFNLKDDSGQDLTDQVLTQKGTHYLLFVKDVNAIQAADTWITQLIQIGQKSNIAVISGMPEKVRKSLTGLKLPPGIRLFTCDVTAIKTAARADVVLYKMNGAVVVSKWSSASARSWN